MFPSGWMAVDVFFIMSGFVLMHSYANKIQNKALSFGQFIKLRLIRLGPLLMVGMVLGIFNIHYSCAQIDANCAAYVPSAIGFGLFSLPYFSDAFWPFGVGTIQSPFPLNGPSWSLFFEFFVNLLFFVWALRFKGLLRWMIIVIGFVGLVLSYHFNGSINGGWTTSNFYVGFPRVTYHFFIGALIQTLYTKYGIRSKAIAVCTVALLFITFCIDSTLLRMVSLFVVAPLAVLLSAKVHVQGYVSTLLKWLGDISYPLYIVHWSTFQLLYLFVDFGHMGLYTKLGCMFAFATAFAWLLVYIDRYFREKLMVAFLLPSNSAN